MFHKYYATIVSDHISYCKSLLNYSINKKFVRNILSFSFLYFYFYI